MKIFVNYPDIDKEEVSEVLDSLKSTFISGDGPYVKKFENLLKDKIGVSHAITTSSASVALELIFENLDFKPGDEIILPKFTIISCLYPILRNKLRPVFVESDRDSWNPKVSEILSKINSKTRAILYVHTYGLGTDLSELSRFAKKRNIYLIEDCAEVQGSNYKSKHMGTFGDIGIFSFYANKLITTGEGGAIVTNNSKLAHRFRKAKNLGFEKKRFIHRTMGWNFRLSNVLAAIGVSQLNRIDKLLDHKLHVASLYKKEFKRYSNKFDIKCIGSKVDNFQQFKNHDRKINITFQPEVYGGIKNTYWVIGLLFENLSNKQIETLRDKLISDPKISIETRQFFYPLDKQPIYKKYLMSNKLPNSSKKSKDQTKSFAHFLFSKGFYIPSGTGFDLKYIPIVVENIIRKVEETVKN